MLLNPMHAINQFLSNPLDPSPDSIKQLAISHVTPQSISCTIIPREDFSVDMIHAVFLAAFLSLHSKHLSRRNCTSRCHCSQICQWVKYRDIIEMVALIKCNGTSDSNLSMFFHCFSSRMRASTSAGDFLNCCCNYNQCWPLSLRELPARMRVA